MLSKNKFTVSGDVPHSYFYRWTSFVMSMELGRGDGPGRSSGCQHVTVSVPVDGEKTEVLETKKKYQSFLSMGT